MGVNGSLLDDTIKKATYTDRFVTGEIKKIHTLMDATMKSLQKLISEDTKPLTVFSKARYKKLIADIKAIQGASNAELRSLITGDLKGFSGVVSNGELAAITKAFKDNTGVTVPVNSILPPKVWGAVTERPLMFPDGTSYSVSDAINTFNVKNTKSVLSVVQQGFIMGDANDVIARNLVSSGVYNGRKSAARTLTRTLTNHVSNISRTYTYQQNANLIYGYQWVSTLDKRTSPVCQQRDGQVHIFSDKDLEKYGAGVSLLPGEVYPPAHYGCRSTTTPLTRSWEDLGIKGIKDAPPSTRASMNGQVPDNLTYADWLKKQPAGIQRDVLGATRYDLWKSGKVKDIGKFYSSNGRYLTLDQLDKKLNVSKPKPATKKFSVLDGKDWIDQRKVDELVPREIPIVISDIPVPVSTENGVYPKPYSVSIIVPHFDDAPLPVRDAASNVVNAIDNWTSGDYSMIRAVEVSKYTGKPAVNRFGELYSDNMVKEASKDLDILTAYIEKAPKYKGSLVRTTGTDLSYLKKGDTYTLRAMASFSKGDSAVFNRDRKTHIILNKSTRGVDIQNISHHVEEAEVLMPKMDFKVVDVQVTDERVRVFLEEK